MISNFILLLCLSCRVAVDRLPRRAYTFSQLEIFSDMAKQLNWPRVERTLREKGLTLFTPQDLLHILRCFRDFTALFIDPGRQARGCSEAPPVPVRTGFSSTRGTGGRELPLSPILYLFHFRSVLLPHHSGNGLCDYIGNHKDNSDFHSYGKAIRLPSHQTICLHRIQSRARGQ